jgi:hypothetical protein
MSFKNLLMLENNLKEINRKKNRSFSPIRNNITKKFERNNSVKLVSSYETDNDIKLTSSNSSLSLKSLRSNDSFIFSPLSSSICLPQLDLSEEDFNIRINNKNKNKNKTEFYITCKNCNCHFLSYVKTNKYCSYKCYKLEHYDKTTNTYNIKCKKCKKYFKTSNLFTDYCSDECFKINNLYKEYIKNINI